VGEQYEMKQNGKILFVLRLKKKSWKENLLSLQFGKGNQKEKCECTLQNENIFE